MAGEIKLKETQSCQKILTTKILQPANISATLEGLEYHKTLKDMRIKSQRPTTELNHLWTKNNNKRKWPKKKTGNKLL